MSKTKEEILNLATGAKTSGGYSHTVTEVQCDLDGTPVRIKGTISVPAITGAQPKPAETVEIFWTLKGMAAHQNRKFDLVTV